MTGAKKRRDALLTVGYYAGRIVTGVGLLMLVPIAVALLYGEWNTVVDFLLGLGVALTVGYGLVHLCYAAPRRLTWTYGMVAASLSWLICMAVGALPYYLSGHWGSYLDAMFDVMSGFTTTGVVLVQDLDHLPNGVNMWRHLLTYVGGQGMVVLALTFLIREMAGAYTIYVGEGKDEKLLPNVRHTAQAIWFVSIVYLVVGTLLQWIAGLLIGMPVDRAFFHGMWVFMGAWSTGGFTPQSSNILYYHSFLYELVGVFIFIIGSFNFALHWAVWTGNRKEIFRNIEVVSFFVTATLLFALVALGLAKTGLYATPLIMLRKGWYQLISAHTTTGFSTLYARQFAKDWTPLALAGIIFAQLIGGSASSTAGGYKGMRVGIIAKALVEEVRRLVAPPSAVLVTKFHHIRDIVLEDRHVRSAALIIILYTITWLFATAVGSYYGYPFLDSAFEAASVTGNVGLSIGITAPSMPNLLKVVYILVMWVGRLEFMSVFAIAGFLVWEVRGR
ncbi:MAG TPA: TrkH family potassium uptake protein [Firmicutes bacterium]|nr:TrkH family potassium uptake protein [Bacillota bacterium]